MIPSLFFKSWAPTLKKECEDKWLRDFGVEEEKHCGFAEKHTEKEVCFRCLHIILNCGENSLNTTRNLLSSVVHKHKFVKWEVWGHHWFLKTIKLLTKKKTKKRGGCNYNCLCCFSCRPWASGSWRCCRQTAACSGAASANNQYANNQQREPVKGLKGRQHAPKPNLDTGVSDRVDRSSVEMCCLCVTLLCF